MASIFLSSPENPEFNFKTFADHDQIALVAGSPNLDTNVIDDALCKQIVECGFNTVSATIGQSNIQPSLVNCGNNGLKLFVHNNSLITFTKEFVRDFKNYPGLGGWRPIIKMLSPQENTAGSDLEKAYKLIVETGDNHPVFIGLNGDWDVDLNNQPLDSFTGYLANYQKFFNPSFWPFVYFPDITTSSNSQTIEKSRVINFFKDLQYFSAVGRYTSTPFWVFCRCQGFQGRNGFNAATPNFYMMRATVFLALAYGAQGIYFWNYRQNRGSYYYAPIDLDGNKTPTWGMLKDINEEVLSFNDVFCGCEMVDCRHNTTFGNEGRQWMKIMTHPIGPLLSVQDNGSQQTPHLVISHIFNNGKNYLVIVSNSFLQEREWRVKLNFSDYYTLYRLYKLGTGIGYGELKVNGTEYTMTVSAGSYYIFRWE